jgi:hypothetical protein
MDEVVNEAMNEHEIAGDGRPDVYTYPLDLPGRMIARDSSRRLLRRGPYDRLLRALQREHGQPRFDLALGLN